MFNSQLQRQNAALLKLAKSSAIDSGDLKQALREITEAGAATLDVKRCSVWSYTPEKDAIVCLDLYEADTGKHSEGVVLKAKDFPAYFQYLKEERFLPADDAVTHPNTYEFAEVYLKPLGITSMLDAPFRRSGEMHGVVCNEHVGPMRHWTLEEQNFAGSLADLVSRAFEAYARRQAQEELKRMNEQLEKMVEERTRQLKETLEQVQALKEQQDADYFLTTLLLKPLSNVNGQPAPFCRLQSLVKQKKSFRFRNREYQIGGDYVFAESILIGNKPFIFAINADAMGEIDPRGRGSAYSWFRAQGPFGTEKVFEHLTGRLAQFALPQAAPRIPFLRRLDDGVFVNGPHRKRRRAYLLSAEHPAPVLYKDGRARLLPVQQVPKLGSTREDMVKGKVPILRIRMGKGDCLILASDGRDDIMIETAGQRQYNEDESVFVDLVAKLGPSPSKMAENLSRIGDITDDLSILALEMV
ncbi:MAG: SpoIIE family protein phosphatase [Turneriella sp.]|nr:SpoIIE family protein phosphatase [Turneriella sp.]